MPPTPIEVRLKSDPRTAISGKAIDERSTTDTLVLVGLEGNVVVIPCGNIAAILMEPDVAIEFFK